jgi:hypothetical protein
MNTSILKSGEGFLQFLKKYHRHLTKTLNFPMPSGPKDFVIKRFDPERNAFTKSLLLSKVKLGSRDNDLVAVESAIEIASKHCRLSDMMDLESMHLYALALSLKHSSWEPELSHVYSKIVYNGNLHLGAEFRMGIDRLSLSEPANFAYIDAYITLARGFVFGLRNNDDAIDIYLNCLGSTGCDELARRLYLSEITSVARSVGQTNLKFLDDCEVRGLLKALSITRRELVDCFGV